MAVHTMRTTGDTEAVRFHDALASQWEAKYRKRGFRERADELLRLLPSTGMGGSHWLDAGCGSGHFSRILAQRGCKVVVGIDASTAMIEAARALISVDPTGQCCTFEPGAIESLQAPDGAFDGVLCSSVLEYVEDPLKCLLEFRRVLKPGGLLLVSVPNRVSVVRRALKTAWRRTTKGRLHDILSYMAHSVNEYTLSEFTQLLSKQGFAVRSSNYAGTALPWFLDSRRHVGTLINVLAERRG